MKWIEPGLVAELDAGGTTAHRVYSAEDAWIERFGGTAVISVKERDAADRLLGQLDRWLERAALSVPRIYLRHLVRQPRENDQPVLLRGDAGGPTKETVRESGLLYEVDFATGYSVGLFCDQRANRRHLRTLAPKRLLNTFSYTCAFSVAGATEGAETLSIDLSKSSLTRGRRNFELNGFDAARHRFLADDVLGVLPRLAGRDEKFDAIILDPPTFGRSSPRKAFRAARDYEDLIVQAVACAAPGASLLLSTNCSALTTDKLCSMGARVARGKATFHREPPQPDYPPGHGSATVWMRLKSTR